MVKKYSNGQKIGITVGVCMGIGSGAGAGIGSILGPVGTGVGVAVGTLVGAITGTIIYAVRSRSKKHPTTEVGNLPITWPGERGRDEHSCHPNK